MDSIHGSAVIKISTSWRTCDKAGAPVMIAFRQAMSYEMLRIVIIGFAKLKVEKAIIS